MLKMDKPPQPRKNRRPTHDVVQTLRLERYKRRMTALELAYMIGYSEKAIYQWEVGISAPRITHLHDWAQALGMKLTLEEIHD